jgi:hypothetical protein
MKAYSAIAGIAQNKMLWAIPPADATAFSGKISAPSGSNSHCNGQFSGFCRAFAFAIWW